MNWLNFAGAASNSSGGGGGGGSGWGSIAAQGGMGWTNKLWNARSAAKAWQRQKKFLKLQQDFGERMSSTAWQRGVADMRAAGINPLLAVSQGGASTPGAGGGSTNMAHREDAMNMLAMRQILAQTRLTNAQEATEVNRAGLVKNQAETMEGLSEIGQIVGEAVRGFKDVFGEGGIQSSTSTGAKGIRDAAERVGELMRSPNNQTGKINDHFIDWLDIGRNWSRERKMKWFWSQDIATQQRLRGRYIRENSQ